MASSEIYDLIVVGSGFAGCMTALNFLEECKRLNKSSRVALVEAGKEGERSGASKWTMAYLRLDKNLDFDDHWVKEMRRVSNGAADEDYCEKLRQEAPLSARYLEDHGVKFVHHDEPNVLLEFNTDQHFVFPAGGGNAIIQSLLTHIKAFDQADILYQNEAVRLLTTDAGSVRGLKVRKTDGLLHDLLAPTVMLACLKYNKGAGLRMCLDVGADTAGSFDGMHCELVDIRADKPDAVIWGHNYGILVNNDCERFYDEGERHLFATFEIAALHTWENQDMSCYFITDDIIMQRFKGSWVYETTDKPPEKSDTIEGLAGKLKIDPKKLNKTVDDFNAAINNKDLDLMKLDGKATTGLKPNKTNWANPIAKAPFYGFPCTPNLTFTYGGVKTDLHSRVLSHNDIPIPGLYASGEMTGLFYNEYPPATSCLRSMTFGRLAGTEIAQKIQM
ncbi:3-ketosteroid 1-dehydrogenase helE [Colletotrichum aenigma]|uniref:3-ketosteroid 1-dehydrogenase helE n=1 Tax=Colletotrichum aenigma TaxID=1215731 RepID=UPI001872CE88|nr:3-ketosteroid 1-dehydrogenase helE [Colletotrichum aenigma]KAF5521767.1 3-ketosteroid 1-dehydrogenase helE [Colletotrichum aenigma]